jgi:DNA-binding SARP family transcriptional activator
VLAFGTLRILRDAQPTAAPVWRRQKSRTLFAYLLCARPRDVHREVLIELLWPGAEAGRGAHALQVALSDVRAALGGHVRRLGDLYGLDLGPGGSVDAETFARECEDGRAADLAGDRNAASRHFAAAESLYAGDFLAEEPFAEWAAARRERLRDDYVDILLRMVRLDEAAGRLDAAARRAKQAVATDPYLEPCYRDLMRLQHALGDPGGVLRTYARCRQAMRDGFDADVAPATQALATSLLGPHVDALVRRHGLARAGHRARARAAHRVRG